MANDPGGDAERRRAGAGILTSVVAALRRLVVVFAIVLGGTVLSSLLLGWLFGSDPQRAVSLGLDVVGLFFLVIGFFVGVRGPFRLGASEAPGVGNRFVRVAQPDERVETINLSALFIGIGIVLVVIGFSLDPRYSVL